MKTNITFHAGLRLRVMRTASTLCVLAFLSAHAHASLAYAVTDLGTLGGSESIGVGINASGQVAGFAQTTGDSTSHAVRWTGTAPTDLGTLGVSSRWRTSMARNGQYLAE